MGIVSIKEKRGRDLKATMEAVKSIASSSVEAGYFDEKAKRKPKAGERGTLTLAQVAKYNNEGTKKIPARPFMKTAMQTSFAKKNSKKIKAQLAGLIQGKGAKGILQALGVLGTSSIQHNIRNGDWKPNSPSTVKKKGSDKPLIDTSQLLQGVRDRIK